MMIGKSVACWLWVLSEFQFQIKEYANVLPNLVDNGMGNLRSYGYHTTDRANVEYLPFHLTSSRIRIRTY